MKITAVTARNAAGEATFSPALISSMLQVMMVRAALIVDLATLENMGLKAGVITAVVATNVPEQYKDKVIVCPDLDHAIQACAYALAPFRPTTAFVYGPLFDLAYQRADEIIYVVSDNPVLDATSVVLPTAFEGMTSVAYPMAYENDKAVAITTYSR